jgi:hypothetical protein
LEHRKRPYFQEYFFSVGITQTSLLSTELVEIGFLRSVKVFFMLDKLSNDKKMSKFGTYKFTEEIKIIKLISYSMWKEWNVIHYRNESSTMNQ